MSSTRPRPCSSARPTLDQARSRSSTDVQYRVAAAVFAEADTAWRVEITRASMETEPPFSGNAAPCCASMSSTSAAASRRVLTERLVKWDVGGAAGRTLGADHVDFTGVALHARLDAHPHAEFHCRCRHRRAQALGHGGGQLIGTLPGRGEFRRFAGAVRSRRKPLSWKNCTATGQTSAGGFCARIGARIAALLQRIGTGVGMRPSAAADEDTMYSPAGRVIGHVARDRQQRIQTLGGR